MKLKSRLRCFWRHNKKCGAMWAILIQVIAIVTPPYGLATIIFLLVAGLWGVIWRKECEVDTLRRCFDIREHQHARRWEALHDIQNTAMSKLVAINLKQRERFLDCYCMTCCNILRKDCLEVKGECKQYTKLVENLNKQEV